MLISNSHKIIFIHITKAAGTSISKNLNKSINWNDLMIGGTRFGEQIQKFYKNRFNLHKHSSAKDIKKTIGEELWDICFKFTFVRHPYSRIVSLYTYIDKLVKSQGIKRYLRFLPIKKINQKQLWKWPATQAFMETNTFSEFIRHQHLKRSLGTRPQVEWILDDSGKIMVDFIGKIENIDSDFRIISDMFQLDSHMLEVHNKSSSKEWKEYLNDENDFEHLYKIYEKDFEILGYNPNLRI